VEWIYTIGDVLMSVVMSSPAVADGKVYVTSANGKIYCLNAETGDFIWDYKLTESPWYMASSPAVADGKVYVGSDGGEVYAFGPTYTLTITTTSGGTTDPTPGTHTYACGSPIEVTAIPDTCYLFDHWELDGVNVGSANPYSVLMDDDHTLHAVFVQITYTLAITATAGGTTNPTPGTHTYACGSSVEVTALPDTDYVFDHWELDGDNVGATNPISVTMDSDHTLHSVFQYSPPPTYDVTIDAYCYTEGTYVSVSIAMDGSPTGYTTPHTFTGLTGTHTFTVPSNDLYDHPFKQWSTGQTSTTITVTTSGTYTALYEYETPPVGGVWVPVDKLGLLAPYIGLASTIIVATAATAIYAKRVRPRKEKR